jgi:hypothetical protein
VFSVVSIATAFLPYDCRVVAWLREALLVLVDVWLEAVFVATAVATWGAVGVVAAATLCATLLVACDGGAAAAAVAASVACGVVLAVCASVAVASGVAVGVLAAELTWGCAACVGAAVVSDALCTVPATVAESSAEVAACPTR